MAKKQVISKHIRAYLSELGQRGGLRGGPARAAALTPEERSESARNAVLARWEKARASKRIAATKINEPMTTKLGKKRESD